MKTINDYFDDLIKSSNKKSNKSVTEIWNGIIDKKNYDELGFDSKEHLDIWIINNPYSNL